MGWEAGKGGCPKANKAKPHLLSNRAFIHLCIDVQVVLSTGGKLRPGHRNSQVFFIGVSVNKIKDATSNFAVNICNFL